MIKNYRELAKRIRRECVAIEQVVQITQQHWQKSKTANDIDVYFNSVALNLHGFYSGLEHLFELIATEVDDNLPRGEQWHVALLQQMTLDVPGTRPSVIQTKTANSLDGYRKFRHVIRNIYTTNLAPSELERLVGPLPQLWKQIKNQLELFAQYLDELSHADEE